MIPVKHFAIIWFRKEYRSLYHHDNCAVLGITQQIVVFSYGRFGTTYRSHLQRSRNLGTETSVRIYHYPLRNNPEERSSLRLTGRRLQKRNNTTVLPLGKPKFYYSACETKQPWKILRYWTIPQLQILFISGSIHLLLGLPSYLFSSLLFFLLECVILFSSLLRVTRVYIYIYGYI